MVTGPLAGAPCAKPEFGALTTKSPVAPATPKKLRLLISTARA
jgi:hypothetical protein